MPPESETAFPTELTEYEVANLDTDAMLDELRGLTVPDDEIPETTAKVEGDTEQASTDAPAAAEGAEGDGLVAAPPLAPPGTVQIGDEFVPLAEAQALLEFSRRMKAEPDTAERVSKAITPSTEPAAFPEWVDPDDAFQVNMYHEHQATKAREEQHAASLRANAERDQRTRVVDSFRSAVTNFKAAHPNLTDENIRQIADVTGQLNIVDGLERTEGSLTAAFERGMEMTMWGTPSLRSLAVADNGASVTDSKTNDRKQKQSALSGSGGSAPRTKPEKAAPSTREDLIDQMLTEVRNDPTLTG